MGKQDGCLVARSGACARRQLRRQQLGIALQRRRKISPTARSVRAAIQSMRQFDCGPGACRRRGDATRCTNSESVADCTARACKLKQMLRAITNTLLFTMVNHKTMNQTCSRSERHALMTSHAITSRNCDRARANTHTHAHLSVHRDSKRKVKDYQLCFAFSKPIWRY